MATIIEKIKNGINLLHNMGWRYTSFRIKHELLMRTGLLKNKFPVNPDPKSYISLQQWKQQSTHFFFQDGLSLNLKRNPTAEIEQRFQGYQAGKIRMFNNLEMELGKDYNWITNPDTGYTFDIQKHWTEIADYSATAGDIKYVWEKSRFSFLYDIIRYDYHFEKDCAALVFKEILSWIDANPVNCGPNYRCSQEISLRVLNWTFALHYYRSSPILTNEVFDKIQFAIYWQMDHVYKHINFSRIAVRNNHAITETLALYLAGTLYPGFPNAAKWKANGKQWFEEEIAYQVYDDGTFLQFSMNYHRVVIQLLTWAIILSEKNNDRLNATVYERAKRSLHFLRVCMNDTDGWLPNYGANDGALFFKLSGAHFRDYRPQLQALASALKTGAGFSERYEDAAWYGLESTNEEQTDHIPDGMYSFETGGYYIIRDKDTLTFTRCGNHKDRPSQADNLHVDIWQRGKNILLDGGSYKYNTDEPTLQYFMGTASHNTVMLDNADQMKKGARFIWYNWTQRKEAALTDTGNEYYFKGTITAFEHLAPGMLHTREIVKKKGSPQWIIKDSITGKPAAVFLKQLWHLETGNKKISWNASDENNKQLAASQSEGFISALYGSKYPCEIISFETTGNQITTSLLINQTTG